MLLPRDLIARCAINFPNKMAYACGAETRTWLEMNRRSDAAARALRKLGVRQGDTVAYFGQECVAVYEHFFACMKLGAVRLGLNWRYSEEELSHLVRDSGARVILVDTRCEHLLAPLSATLAELGVTLVGCGVGGSLAINYERLLEVHAEDQPLAPVQITGDDALMLTYTSGTTGRPKGVIHRQSAIASMIFQSIIARGLAPDDIFSTAAASSWMTVVLNLMGLGNGMGHVIPDGTFEIRAFLGDAQRHRVTAIMLVPTLVRRAIDEVKSGAYDLGTLRLLMYGSAPASTQLIRDAYATLGCEMVQSYGMTEAGWTTQLSAADHRHAVEHEPGLLKSAGRPGVLSEVEVRDDGGRRLAAGQAGNVWIRSSTLMKGYLNMPAETAEALHGDWLCSNDVGYVDERGYLFLTDRRKFMIISGAVNIFPSSVENALLEHQDVVEAAVVGAPHPEWGEAVVAVVRPRAGVRPDVAALHAHCDARLNRMERPKHIFLVDDFPRSVNGKIQKQQVKDWVAANQLALPWASAPRTEPRAAEPQT